MTPTLVKHPHVPGWGHQKENHSKFRRDWVVLLIPFEEDSAEEDRTHYQRHQNEE
jgi:hypothetical protein